MSALIANLIARWLYAGDFTIDVGQFGAVVPADYLPALLLGCFCAGMGILLMKGVSLVEGFARRSFIPAPLRPALGGIVVGLLALISPQVLSAGHGALHLNLASSPAIPMLIGLFLMKSLASAISIGSGFRGGLFFASLFMGALLGKLFAFSAPYIFAQATLTPVIYAVVGMSALAVAVIGGPLTMTFLALEITGDFPITVLVLAAVITSSLVVRHHLRLLVCHMALSPARREHPQRPRCRLDPQPYRRPPDAHRCSERSTRKRRSTISAATFRWDRRSGSWL